MRHVYLHEEQTLQSFAKTAAEHFAEHPEHWTYALTDPVPSEYLALRWGAGKDCVLVVLLDPNFEPVIYGNIIRAKEPTT